MYKRRIGGRVAYVGKAAYLSWKGEEEEEAVAEAVAESTLSAGVEIDPEKPWADMSDAEAAELREDMGQTGDEAGRPRAFRGDPGGVYIQTSKSYLINNALRTDMTSLTDGHMTEGAEHWIREGYTMADARAAIRQIDRGMKPLPEEIRTVRYEGLSRINEILKASGVGVTRRAGMSDDAYKDAIRAKLRTLGKAGLDKYVVGSTIDNKTYISTSWRMGYSERDESYKSSPVKVEYSLGKGVNAIVTNNIGEHEILVGRGYSERVVGATVSPSGQIVMRVEIVKSDRPQYYKV